MAGCGRQAVNAKVGLASSYIFGLPTASAEKPAYSVRDIWERKDAAMVQLGTNQTWAVQKVPPHDSVFLMFSPHKH